MTYEFAGLTIGLIGMFALFACWPRTKYYTILLRLYKVGASEPQIIARITGIPEHLLLDALREQGITQRKHPWMNTPWEPINSINPCNQTFVYRQCLSYRNHFEERYDQYRCTIIQQTGKRV